MQWQKTPYLITTDPAKIDLDTVVRFLCQESYWARDIPPETVVESIRHSLCFSLFDDARQIGFARMITDYAVFGYLEDVFIDSSYRGQGLARWLLECVMSHPDVNKLKKLMLTTTDAQTLYQKFGFTELANPQMVMERYNRERFQLPDWATPS